MLYVVDWFYEPVHGIGYDQTNPCPVWDLIIVFWCILPTDDFPTQMVIVAMFDCDNLICHRCKANPCTYSSGPIDRRPCVKLFEDVDDISWFCNWAGLINQQYPIVQLQNQQGTIVVVNQSYRTIIAGSQFFFDSPFGLLNGHFRGFGQRQRGVEVVTWGLQTQNSARMGCMMKVYARQNQQCSKPFVDDYILCYNRKILYLMTIYVIYILYYDYILCYIMCHYLLII